MTISEQHFAILRECYDDIATLYRENTALTSTWVGKSARKWLTTTGGYNSQLDRYGDTAFNRTTLRDYISLEKDCGAAAENIFQIVVNILAWGGMQYNHGRTALRCWDKWQPICLKLISGDYNHIDAYDAFFAAHNDGSISGIGPAYYTKLIFFLGDGNGLIMDQWTSKSINLIQERNTIKLSNGYVSKFANSENYDAYIQAVSEISQRLDMTGAALENLNNAEELIFSISSKKKPTFLAKDEHQVVSRWRAYVEKEWRHY